MPISMFMNKGHGDLTIEWNQEKHDEVVAEIQRLMDAGVHFFRLEETGKVRKTLTGVEISEIAADDRKLVIKDADLKKIFDKGLASIVSFTTIPEIKTKPGAIKSAEEVAATDTVSTKPKEGG